MALQTHVFFAIVELTSKVVRVIELYSFLHKYNK